MMEMLPPHECIVRFFDTYTRHRCTVECLLLTLDSEHLTRSHVQEMFSRVTHSFVLGGRTSRF
jgi:hypothetical protein